MLLMKNVSSIRQLSFNIISFSKCTNGNEKVIFAWFQIRYLWDAKSGVTGRNYVLGEIFKSRDFWNRHLLFAKYQTLSRSMRNFILPPNKISWKHTFVALFRREKVASRIGSKRNSLDKQSVQTLAQVPISLQ